MSDFSDFMQRLDQSISSVVDELSEREETRRGRDAARAKPSIIRTVVLPALALLGILAAVWLAT